MGGKSLKKTKTERKGIIDYQRIKSFIMDSIQKYFIQCEVIKEPPEKESFGDLDIIYLSEKNIDVKQLIIDILNPSEIINLGEIITFAYDSFQIDLIKTYSPEDYLGKKFYYSYGDLGCIMGKMIHFYGLKFGIQGLWIQIQKSIDDKPIDISRVIGKDLILTTDPEKICEYFDLDWNKYVGGFENKKEIFDWICISKYFTKGIFQIDNINDKKRMENRPMYQEFMKYIWGDIIDDTKPDKISIQQLSIDYFNKQEELDLIISQAKLLDSRTSKYNGKQFISYGILGKSIPPKMKEFEFYIENKTKKNFWDWIDNVESIDVFNEIGEFTKKN
jgi:hypothetical protein